MITDNGAKAVRKVYKPTLVRFSAEGYRDIRSLQDELLKITGEPVKMATLVRAIVSAACKCWPKAVTNAATERQIQTALVDAWGSIQDISPRQ